MQIRGPLVFDLLPSRMLSEPQSHFESQFVPEELELLIVIANYRGTLGRNGRGTLGLKGLGTLARRERGSLARGKCPAGKVVPEMSRPVPRAPCNKQK